ncbi:MAG: AI-2E family transporter, partial [Oligoflexia bacterium]|nr:AI-2E family transporter [Oligoflexia bacterium]
MKTNQIANPDVAHPETNNRNFFSQHNKRGSKSGRMIFFIILVITTVGFLLLMPRLSIPLLLAYVAGLILEQITPIFTKVGLSKPLALVIILVGLSILLSYPLIKAIPLASEEIDRIQQYIPKVDHFVRSYYLEIKSNIKQKVGIELGETHLQNLLIFLSTESKNILLKIPILITTLLEWSLLIPLFLFFILRDGRSGRINFLKLIPNPIFERTYNLWAQFNKQLGEYIFAKFIEATIIGVITMIGLFSLQIPFAILLATSAALTNIIPYLGPILGIIPALIVSAIEFGLFS